MNCQRFKQRHRVCLAALAAGLLASGCIRAPGRDLNNTPDAWREAMQPPLAPGEVAQISSGLTLSQAVTLGVMRHPGIAAQRRLWLAAIEVEPQASSLPDPSLQFGYQFESVETRVGPQQWNWGLSQKLPWWRKLWSRGRIAATRADIALLRYEAAVRDLIIQIKDSYYELYYLDRAMPITEKIETMLRNDALLAYQELTVGRTQLNEAFRAESQAAQLAYDRILLAEQRAAQAERLRSLLNLPPETDIGPIETAPVYPVSENITQLFERAEHYAEILRIRGLEIESANYVSYLAKLSRIPDIAVGFNVISTNGGLRMPNGDKPEDNGKNPLIGLFSMNLPIWEQRNRALIREKEAIQEAMRLRAIEETNRVRQGVAQTYFAARLTRRLTTLYAETLLPQAEAVLGQAEIFFRNDQASFSTVIEATLAYHNFQLAYHRSFADLGQAIGRLEQTLGTTAESRSPGEEG